MDNGRTGRSRQRCQASNSQTPQKNTTFLGFCDFGSCARRARPGECVHGRMAEISHLFSCWQTHEAQVFWTNLMWQVEREGSMDWIGLLIPLKIVVFCVILVVIYRMMSGWNSTKLLKLPGGQSCSYLHGPAAGPSPGSNFECFKLLNSPVSPNNIFSTSAASRTGRPGDFPPPKLSPRKVLHYKNICVIR